MSKLEIIQFAVIAVIALVLIIVYTIKAIKNKWVGELLSCIKEACKKAEQSGKSGAEKKAMVLADIEAKCTELGIPYKLISTLVIKVIEQVVSGYNAITK